MKIAFNPSTVAALTSPPNNKDITFDLKGHNIFARGVKFYGTDTNTWRDIKINNVSIGSNILDLRNGSNTTLTNTNGVVTINSTWRPVVDNLTSNSTTSSLSANLGRVLKALIDGKSNSGHTHDDRYLKLTGGTMASNALITFADSGSWDTDKGPQGARGGLYWSGQSDYAKLYAEETVGDNLDLVIQFGDDNSNGLSIRNKSNVQTSYISAGGVITTGTFKGNLDWSYITNKPATATRWPSWAEVTGKPSSFTPSTHTHGLSNSVFFLSMPSISGNAKWKEVFGYPVNYNLLLSVRINSPAPEWCVGNYGSGILYGGGDTKGFMSSSYNEPLIMWAGGNGSSDDSVPKWYIGIRGTHKSIYNLTTIASEANAAYNLRHSHANKSVLDGITSGLVNNWNTAYTFVHTITGTDTDKVINKWDEIVNFLAGITEDNKLNTLLNSKLSVYQLADKTNVGAIKNNGIYYSTSDASSGTLTNSPFNNGFTLINMTSLDGGDDLRRSRLAFNAFGEIKVSDDRGQSNTAETWYNVLTSKNSGISGSTIKLNGTSITVYSSGTADGRYVKKTGDTMSGVLTIDTTNFGALIIKRNDDTNGASIQFRGKSSVYGYIGLNNNTKDKQFLRYSSDTSKVYTILDTSSTYTSSGKGVINGTTITQVDNATNATNSTNARKLVNWYSARPTSLNAQFGDGSLRIFYATSSTTEGKPAEDSHILHLAWDNTGGWDAQLAVHIRSGKVSTRAQNGGTWQPWKTLAFANEIPSSLKNPHSFNVFGVTYDGSAAKTVTTSTFISLVNEATSTITDGTMLITSYASNGGFADTNAVNVPYKRKAVHLWEYIRAKTDFLYAIKDHNHDGRYVRSFGTSNDNIDSDWGLSFKTFDPIPSGTPPEKNPNISLLSIGENFNRRKQLAFTYSNDNIYYRRHTEGGFSNWRRLAFANEIPTSLKNPHALTISLNGTSQGPYDGSAAKSINITAASIGAATSGHNHDNRYVRKWTGVYGSANKFLKLAISNEKGWIRLEISDSNNSLTAGYGIYMIGWGYHDNNADTLIVKCLYANDSQYTTALKVVRTSINNYDFYFLFASNSSYPSYTINYSSSIISIDCTVTAIATIPTATWTSSLSALQLNASLIDWSGITNKPSTFNPAAHTHTVFSNNLMIKGTNGISDSASIHLGIGDSDTGFKWISDGKCLIYANNVAVGEWTPGGMNWFKNPTVNGNKVWNAGNDGSGSGLDADTLDGYHESSFLRYRGATSTDLEATLWSLIGIKLYNNALPDDLTNVYNYGSVISLPGSSSRFEIYASHLSSKGNGLYYRSGWGDDKKTWLKFIDSSNIGSLTVTNAYHLRINSANSWSTWNWAGLSGQPSWLWGSNDGTNMYVWNPSNFRVAYASSAGNADTLDGEHANSFVRAGTIDTKDTDLNALDTFSFVKSINSKVADHSPKGNNGWYNVILLVHRNGSGDGPSYIGQIALGMTTNTDDMFFRGKRTDSWKTVIHSGNIGSLSVNYANSANHANSAGNASTLGGTSLGGLFTAFGNNAHNITATIGGVTKSFLVNWAADSDKLDGKHASDFATAGHNHDGRYLKLSGGTLTGGIEIQGTISGSNYAYSEGFYTNEHNSLILRGDATYGKSGILFTSSKGTNSINQTSDKGFIQFLSYGGTNTTGEENKLVIGVGNDSTDMVYIQTPSATGLKHIVGTNSYTIWDSGNLTKLSQLTNDKGFVTGSVNGKTITINGTSTTWSNTWRPISDDYEKGDASTSLSTLGSLTLYNDLLSVIPTIPTIPNPTNYYWANIKISASSNSETSPTFNTAYATNWFRAKGNTGFYFLDHAGGFYMEDNTWIKTWGSKALYVNNTIRSTNYQAMYGSTSVSAAKLESATDLVYGTDTSSNSINSYLRGTTVTLLVKKGASINYNALLLTDTYIYCNNYCDMKYGAIVSGGNFTVNNNSYLAQSSDAKVGIGTGSPSCLLDVSGLAKVYQLGIYGTPDANTLLYVNGHSKLLNLYLNAYRDKYFKLPVCLEFITFKNYAINSTIWSSPKSSKTNDVVALEIPNLSVPDKYKVFVFVTSDSSPNIYASIVQTAPLLLNIVTGGVSNTGQFAIMIWAIPT